LIHGLFPHALVAIAALAPAQDDAIEMTAKLILAGNSAEKEDFEALARLGSVEAFAGLKVVIEELTWNSRLGYAFEALRYFRGAPFEPQVIAFIAGKTSDRDEDVRRHATWALVDFRKGAQDELWKVVKSSKDARCRGIALQGVLDAIEAEHSLASLALLLENAILGTTVWRPRLVGILSTFRGEEAVQVLGRALADRDVSPFVKTAVVDSLYGRPELGPGSKIVRDALRVKHPAVEYATLRLLLDPAGTDPAPFRGEITRLERSSDPSVRRLATILEGRVRSGEPAEDQYKWLRRLATATNPAERQGAAFLLAELGTEEAAGILHGLLEDPDRSVASEALQATGEMRRYESIPVLIALLEKASGQPRFDVARTLGWLTGEDHGLAAARWKAWWDAEGQDFRMPLPEEVEAKQAERQERREENESKAVFYGLPVVSERLVFVLDVSGSMEHEVSKDTTRLDVALRELDHVLDLLPNGVLVNVVFFSTEIRSWEKAPVELNDVTRARLRVFIRSQEPDGQTNLYDALEFALLDRRIDTVFLLTDGLPEGGATEDRYQIRTEVERWNSTGHVVIHGVAVGSENELVRALTEATGGRYLLAQ